MAATEHDRDLAERVVRLEAGCRLWCKTRSIMWAKRRCRPAAVSPVENAKVAEPAQAANNSAANSPAAGSLVTGNSTAVLQPVIHAPMVLRRAVLRPAVLRHMAPRPVVLRRRQALRCGPRPLPRRAFFPDCRHDDLGGTDSRRESPNLSVRRLWRILGCGWRRTDRGLRCKARR